MLHHNSGGCIFQSIAAPTNVSQRISCKSAGPTHANPSQLGCCTPPEYMSDRAKEAWDYAVANSPPYLLSGLDGAVLERWANCPGMYREAVHSHKSVPSSHTKLTLREQWI